MNTIVLLRRMTAVSVLFMVVMSMCIASGLTAPADPFPKAKEMAMSAVKDPAGFYMWRCEVRHPTYGPMIVLMIYTIKDKEVVIVLSDGYFMKAVQYLENTDKYEGLIIQGTQLMARKEISTPEATQFGFDIFKLLVQTNSI